MGVDLVNVSLIMEDNAEDILGCHRVCLKIRTTTVRDYSNVPATVNHNHFLELLYFRAHIPPDKIPDSTHRNSKVRYVTSTMFPFIKDRRLALTLKICLELKNSVAR